MELLDLVFYFFAVVIVASAAIVVFSKNIMYSAFSLLFTFFGVAAFYVLLNADFLAVTQLMIYIGGILILIIFGVMLTSKITGVDIKSGIAGKLQITVTALLSLGVCAGLVLMFTGSKWLEAQPLVQLNSTVAPIGVQLLTGYLLAFEVASVLLLIAIVGAALIARRKAE